MMSRTSAVFKLSRVRGQGTAGGQLYLQMKRARVEVKDEQKVSCSYCKVELRSKHSRRSALQKSQIKKSRSQE